MEEILARATERSRTMRQEPPRYEFTRLKRSRTFDKTLNVLTESEAVYRMEWKDGELRARLLSQKGPDSAALREKDDGDRAHPRKAPASEGDEKGRSVLFRIDESTKERFRFVLAGKEELRSRPTFIVDVLPRTDLPAHGIEHKVMAKLSGRIWVDQEDYEISKVDVRLTDSVSIGWGGLLGALHTFNFKIDRNRIADGGWVNSAVHLFLHFRQLFEAKRFAYDESVSDVLPIQRSVTVSAEAGANGL